MSTRPRPSTLGPQIDTVRHGPLTRGTSDLLAAKADLESLSFEGVDTSLLTLRGGTVHDCHFAGISVREADWSSTRFHDTTVDRLDVPVMRAPRGVWRQVSVTGARLGSVEAYEASWHSVHFVGCKLGFVNLRAADLVDVAFTDCIIEELDLVQSTARRVAFRESRASRLNLQHSTLEHVDLRGVELDEIEGLDGLSGATISRMQLELLAPILAREKGVKVEDL